MSLPETETTRPGEVTPHTLAHQSLSIFLSHDSYVWEIMGGCRSQFQNPDRFLLTGSDDNYQAFSVDLLRVADQEAFGKTMTQFLPNLAQAPYFTVLPEGTADTTFVGEREMTIIGAPIRHRDGDDQWRQLWANRALRIRIVNDGQNVTVPSFTMMPLYS